MRSAGALDSTSIDPASFRTLPEVSFHPAAAHQDGEHQMWAGKLGIAAVSMDDEVEL